MFSVLSVQTKFTFRYIYIGILRLFEPWTIHQGMNHTLSLFFSCFIDKIHVHQYSNRQNRDILLLISLLIKNIFKYPLATKVQLAIESSSRLLFMLKKRTFARTMFVQWFVFIFIFFFVSSRAPGWIKS